MEQWTWGYGTDTRQRGENQDCHGVFQFSNCTLFVVCDGMGGRGGAQASALGTDHHDTIKEKEESPTGRACRAIVRRIAPSTKQVEKHRLQGGNNSCAAAVHDGLRMLHVGSGLLVPGKIET